MLQHIASRSERRFEKSVDKAILAHQRKLDDGKFSLTPEQGVLAVIASRGTTVNSAYLAAEQISIFREEAERVAASELASHYSDVKILPAVNNMDIDFCLAEKEVAGIVLIGHGTIASLRLHQDKHMNWFDASRSTKELKLGHFVQRMCGQFKSYDSIPMGTFAVADQRNIIAATGVPIADKNPDETLFQPVYMDCTNDAQTLYELRDEHLSGR